MVSDEKLLEPLTLHQEKEHEVPLIRSDKINPYYGSYYITVPNGRMDGRTWGSRHATYTQALKTFEGLIERGKLPKDAKPEDWIETHKHVPPPARPRRGSYNKKPKEYHEAKHDEGKTNYTLLYMPMLDGIAKVREYGNKKYAPDSWKDVPNAVERYINALMRHCVKVLEEGIDAPSDDDPSFTHLDQVLCNAMFLTYFRDRCKKELKLK